MNRRIRTNPLHLALLESAQKLGLQRNGHFADFIKKERSAIGLDKAAVPPSFRACKRAFLMAEQFGFEQVLGKGRAVYRNQRFCGARTGPVQGSRHQLLARAGFSSNKDCRFRGRNGFDKSEHGLHGRALAQNLRVLFVLAQLAPELAVFHAVPRTLDALAQRFPEKIEIQRLHKIVIGPDAQGIHRCFHGRIRSHEDYRQSRIVLQNSLERVNSINSCHAHVCENRVERLFTNQFDGLIAIGSFIDGKSP